MSKPLNNENASVAKENVLVPEIVNKEAPDTEKSCREVAEDSLKISDKYDTYEDVPKKSYASVVSRHLKDPYSTLFHLVVVLTNN